MTLRIQKAMERQSAVVFTFAGRIQAEQVEEIQSLFDSELAEYEIVLDLKHVMLVDHDAVRFLTRSEAQGIELRNCSAYIREWIRQERHAMELEDATGLRG